MIDEASVKKVVSVLEDLEAKLQKPFNRFSDTLEADEIELNFKYVIQVSLCRRLSYAGHPPVKSAILATDATMIHYARLHAVLTQGSPINVRVFRRSRRNREVARRTARAANNGSPDNTGKLNRSICCSSNAFVVEVLLQIFQTLRLSGLVAGRLATEALQERWQQSRQSLLMVRSGIDFSGWR